MAVEVEGDSSCSRSSLAALPSRSPPDPEPEPAPSSSLRRLVVLDFFFFLLLWRRAGQGRVSSAMRRRAEGAGDVRWPGWGPLELQRASCHRFVSPLSGQRLVGSVANRAGGGKRRGECWLSLDLHLINGRGQFIAILYHLTDQAGAPCLSQVVFHFVADSRPGASQPAARGHSLCS